MPGPPFAILAVQNPLVKFGEQKRVSIVGVHLVENVLLVAAVQLLHRRKEFICSNSTDHLGRNVQ